MRDCMNSDGGKARQIEHVRVGFSDVEAERVIEAMDFARAHGLWDEEPHKRTQAVHAQTKVTEALERAR